MAGYHLLETEIRRQERLLLRATRKKYFATIDTIEIEKQATESPSEDTYTRPVVIHELEQRSRVAKDLFTLADDLDDAQFSNLRIQAVQNLVELCKLREIRPLDRLRIKCEEADQDEKAHLTSDALDAQPLICGETQCLFCLGDNTLPDNVRSFCFSRVDVVRKHVQNSHLKYVAPDEHIDCPLQQCHAVLESVEHFKNHAGNVHGVFY
jgi:hypothetical protein